MQEPISSQVPSSTSHQLHTRSSQSRTRGPTNIHDRVIVFLVLTLLHWCNHEVLHDSKFAMVNWIYNTMKNVKVVLCALHGIMLCIHGQIDHLQKLSILCL